MNALTPRPPWYARVIERVRAALPSLPSVRQRPPVPGLTGRRLAVAAQATDHLAALAQSPTVYGAVTGRALGLVVYPVRVYLGQGISDRPEPLEPAEVPWAGQLLRLLERPDPADWLPDSLFPAHPGESLLAQLLADLQLAGNCYVAPEVSEAGAVIGLSRLHPRLVTLEIREGAEVWVYRPGLGRERVYPRRVVAHGRLLSWSADARGELGVGAGEPLAPLVSAESEALRQTAHTVRQGGADVAITAKTPAGMAFLSSRENRESVARQATEQLAGGPDGTRRVVVIGGDIELGDLGLSPADLRAPETLLAARQSELVALGVTPVSVGSEAGTYATAVQQLRVQAASDDALVYVLEVALLRPLARHFARGAGGRWAALADRVTCRIDLAGHPGYGYLRSEQVARARQLVELGWSPEQASDAEGLDLPPPEGRPWYPAPAAPPPGAAPGAGAPASPVGSGGEGGADPGEGPPPTRRLGDLLRAAPPPAEDLEQVRSTRWRAVDEARATADRDLEESAQAVLDSERDAYDRQVAAALAEVAVAGRARGTRQEYGPVDWGALLGDPERAADRWRVGLRKSWLDAWTEASARALAGVDGAEGVPLPDPTDDDEAPLRESSAAAAQTSRERVRQLVEEGIARGDTIQEIRRTLQADQVWAAPRALRVARTEAVRSETAGQQRRYEAAADQGLTVRRQWLSARDSSVRDSHRALDGVEVALSEDWQIPGGPRTRGPGLSGDGSEDIHCRCTTVPVLG